nr:rho GTPase-activating protein 11A-like [Pogona vitticeps]
MSSLEEREHLPAIIHYLKRRGVHAQLWKANPTSQENHRSAPLAGGLFGVPLHSLPLSERAEGVPQFLVDACELLRPHLHIEGLFRKCGSLTRIKALKRRLEAGERCLEMALPCDVATLVKQFLRDLPEPLIPAPLQGPLCQTQSGEKRLEAGERCLEMALPCDVATLVKQFLRDLPEPLIPAPLQGPLCQTQQRGDPEEEEADQGSLALLLTCLLPPKSAAVLRYLFCFLQDVASRCTQNKMDLANLAIIFAPNLFSAEPCGQLGSRAEGQLQRQAAVIQVLISRASEIGTVPQILLEKVRAAFSDLDSEKGQPPPEPENPGGRGLEGRRRRRRSMGNIVTEALSKFKTGRALCTAPCPEIKGDALSNNMTLKTSFNSKRKASDDVGWTTELSAKKRRSILDSANSEPFDGNGRDPPDEAGDLNPVQVPTTATPVFSSNDSTPVSDTRPDLPRAPSGKVQRRRSGGGKHSQRKHSVHTPPCCSPTSFERKNKGRKSLRIFSRGSKDLVPRSEPLPTSPKAAEPGGWLLTKVAEGREGLALQPR